MAPPPTSTLQTVAELAGVSVSTASRALRGSARLRAETIAQVQAAAAQVGYRANPYISDVMRRVRGRGRAGHLGAIAYLTFHDSANGWQRNATYARFHEGAAQRAAALGFTLDTIWAREPKLSARRLTAVLEARGIAGVVVGPRPAAVAPDILDWSRFSSASVGVPLAALRLHQAGSHHARLMERLLAALAARAYRRPGLVLLEPQVSKTDPGWVATWVHHEWRLPTEQRVPLLVLPSLEPRAFRRWLKRHRPDVVIGVESALVGMLRDAGYNVPADIGFAHLSRPERTDAPAGMDQCPREIGAAAVELVVSQVLSNERGPAVTPRMALIEGVWREGWTTRRLDAAD